MTSLTVLVVPAFNEQSRLEFDRFARFATEGVHLLFVDDGSTDATASMLQAIADAPAIEVLSLARNVGKAEAVRLGLLQALRRGATVVGYMDADLATPEDEMLRLIRILCGRPDCEVLLAARIDLLGRTILRKRARHYAGRVFATVASVLLHLRVYDTQCGAKVFRASPSLSQALATPFGSRWAFDVELLGRLRAGTRTTAALPVEAFLEVPLEKWTDVAGSKLTLFSALRAAYDLMTTPSRLRVYRTTRSPVTSATPGRGVLEYGSMPDAPVESLCADDDARPGVPFAGIRR